MSLREWWCENPSCKKKLDYTPRICCNAFDCGCKGLPVDPPVCSEACYNALYDYRNETAE